MSKKIVLLFTFITVLLCAFVYQRPNLENIEKIEPTASTITVISCGVEFDDNTNIYIQPIFMCLTLLWYVSLFFQVIGQAQKVYLWKVELPVFWGAKYRIQSPRCKITNEYSNLFLDFLWLL